MATEEKILDRVRALLAVAEHPGTGVEEADTALRMANALMSKYAIDEALARKDMSEEQRRKPTNIKFAWKTTGLYEFSPMLRTVLDSIAELNRCKAAFWSGGEAEVFGMEQDVHWVEMLYLSVYYQFLSMVNPKWDETKGYDENVYTFKVAGYKWLDINKEAMRHGERDTRIWEDRTFFSDPTGKFYFPEIRNLVEPEEGSGDYWRFETPTEKMTGVLKAAYKRHAAKIGDTNQVMTASHTEYRRQFAEAFGSRIARRVREMTNANAEEIRLSGAEVALRDMAEEVSDAFYAAHPHLDPKNIAAKYEQSRREREEMLNRMTPAERHAFLEKEEAEKRRQAKRNARYWKDLDNSYQAGAHLRGQRAADKVDLTRKAGYAESGANRSAIEG